MALTAIAFFAITSRSLEDLRSIEVSDIDLSKVSDGTYSGSYTVFPVAVELKVTVVNHQITKIDIIKHENGKGKAAEAITGDVITKQSLKVDTVSGVTYSSKVILLAIEDALSK